MGLWWRAMLAMVVAFAPGGFVLLFAYVAARAVRARLEQARAQGTPVSVWRVLGSIEVRHLLHEARAAL